MSYTAEIKNAERRARKACPVAYMLLETLRAAESAHGANATLRAALDEAAAFCADAFRESYENYRGVPDISELQARMVLESVGLLSAPDLVTVCGDCMREHVGECAAQRRSNLRRERTVSA